MLVMYKGTIIHVFVTLFFCFFGMGWTAVVFYIGRELAQAEYRYIEVHGGKRENCPWYCGFISKSWTLKSILDWFLPFIVTLIYTILM